MKDKICEKLMERQDEFVDRLINVMGSNIIISTEAKETKVGLEQRTSTSNRLNLLRENHFRN